MERRGSHVNRPTHITTPSQQRSGEPSTNRCAARRRLQSELMNLMMDENSGISAFPECENMFLWVGTIKGVKGTAYEGLTYKLSLHFPMDYPFSPPEVKFETPCFHPNVDLQGCICLDILQDKWSSAYDCRTVLLSIQSLLGEPNNESPLNEFAAFLWTDQEEFRKEVQKQYHDGGGVIEP